MRKENYIDIENGVLGHDFYIMMRDDLLGEDYSSDELRYDGAIYMGDGIWLTVDGEFVTEE